MIAEESQEGQGRRRVVAPVTRLVTLAPKPTAASSWQRLKAGSIRFRGIGTGRGEQALVASSAAKPASARLLLRSAPSEADCVHSRDTGDGHAHARVGSGKVIF